MKQKKLFTILLVALNVMIFSCKTEKSQNASEMANESLYQYQPIKSRWSSFENPDAAKGNGGKENNGAKGHACDSIKAGSSKVLLKISGSGVINRIWITINDRSPKMLRSLKIEMFWDGELKPAVSAPFGDFFGIGLGQRTPFENELFADPEGRSFVSYIQMPFKTGAKIVVTNQSSTNLDMIFYDINFTLAPWKNNNLYFHTYWNRDTATTLASDFIILPKVKGKGRFLGSNIGVIANPNYEKTWWGEGEVKVYLDNDPQFPTLVGSGTEDYVGSAWGLGKFINRYSGCTVADETNQQWAFYRYHIPDPIYFQEDCIVKIQGIGGAPKEKVISMMDKGVNLIPITIHELPKMHHLYKKGEITNLKDKNTPEGWTNFYRSDDWSATAYFYLDKPANELPVIQDTHIRTYKTPNK